MINIQDIRNNRNSIIVLGNHEGIIQSILDFDYLSDKNEGSIVGIVAGRAGFAKYFFGRKEILVHTYQDIRGAASHLESNATNYWFLNLLSGRRTLTSTQELMNMAFAGGVLFAEGVPEQHALTCAGSSQLIVGPASVGLLIPGVLKMGPIGGITPTQLEENALTQSGELAVFSASGGMTNELINIAVSAGHHLSFALSFGGDRFPVLTPKSAFLLAEQDPRTKAVLYYGELGGEDEYELVELIRSGQFHKPVIAHIAGTVASIFPESPQFGHAKAKADNAKVTAQAKRQALGAVGVQVSTSFSDFVKLVKELKS